MHLHTEGEIECASGHRRERLKRELSHHLPYSLFSSVASVAILGAIWSIRPLDPANVESLFHVAHPAHLFLSAIATTAMFWIHDKRRWKACLIGIIGSLGFCGVSDIILPYLGGLAFGWPMQLHLCFVEEPGLVLPFVALGVATGLVAGEFVHRATVFSHSGHVLVSSMASLLYPVSFGISYSVSESGWLLLIVLVAVLIPCCFSDIVFPLLFARGRAPSARYEVDVTPPVEDDHAVPHE
ncbi:MAG: hypothetical protein HYY93_01710 [Planctomycetes bacterium]|nr:hypothetical protein [Planctomycetota bacterium]